MTPDIRPHLRLRFRHNQPIQVRGAPADAPHVPKLSLPSQQSQRLRPPVCVSHRPHANLQRLGYGRMAHLVLAGLDGPLREQQDAGVQVGDVLEVALGDEPLAPLECFLVSHSSPFAEGHHQGAEPHPARGLLSGSDCAVNGIASFIYRFGPPPVVALCFSMSLRYSNRHSATDRRV